MTPKDMKFGKVVVDSAGSGHMIFIFNFCDSFPASLANLCSLLHSHLPTCWKRKRRDSPPTFPIPCYHHTLPWAVPLPCIPSQTWAIPTHLSWSTYSMSCIPFPDLYCPLHVFLTRTQFAALLVPSPVHVAHLGHLHTIFLIHISHQCTVPGLHPLAYSKNPQAPFLINAIPGWCNPFHAPLQPPSILLVLDHIPVALVNPYATSNIHPWPHTLNLCHLTTWPTQYLLCTPPGILMGHKALILCLSLWKAWLKLPFLHFLYSGQSLSSLPDSLFLTNSKYNLAWFAMFPLAFLVWPLIFSCSFSSILN